MVTFEKQVEAHKALSPERTQEWITEELEKVREKIASTQNATVIKYLRKREGYLMDALK